MSSKMPSDSSLLGFLRPESVQHTEVHVGRGASGIVHRGWLTLPDGARIEVAIKSLAPEE